MKIDVAWAHSVWRGAVVGIVLLWPGGSPAWSQSFDQAHVVPLVTPRSSPTNMQGRPLSVDVDLVLVPTIVTDALNRPVTTLRQQNFSIYDGDRQQEIKYFNEEDAPISIGILLDTSGSMKNKFVLARDAVSEFFRNSNRDDDYFVITYSDKPEVLADTTQSVEEIEGELANVTPSGSTPLLDAIYLGLTKLKHARYQRRALLVISDGGDNDSRYTGKEIRAMVRESDVQIYALGIFASIDFAYEDRADKKLLNDIAGATGGRAVFLSSADKLPEVASAFSRELRSEYVLGYRPPILPHDGKVHKITVRVVEAATYPLQLYYKRQYLALR